MMSRRGFARLLVAGSGLVVVLLPVGAALLGARAVRTIRLNCGPGDGPYVSGFASPRPESFDPYEIEDQVATHWTTHDARVALPLVIDAPAVGVVLRFARHFADRGHLDLRLAGKPAARFEIREGYEEYQTTQPLSAPAPVVVDLHTDAQDDRGLGVSLDWVRLDLPAGGRVRLSGFARFRPALFVVAVLLVLAAGGWTPRFGVAVAALPSLLAVVGLLLDPWLVHRLITGIPAALVLIAPVVFVLRIFFVGRRRLPAADFALALALFLAAAVPRALLANHPDGYSPDLMIHARLAKLMHRAGAESFLQPDLFLGRFQESRQSFAGMPYSLAFHAPLAILDPPYDQVMTVMKLAGAFLSALPVTLGVLLVRRAGLSLFGAGLLVVAPTYPHWLFKANLPALFGHVFDFGLLVWLVGHLEDLGRPRTFVTGALLVAATQLGYAFGLPVSGLLVLFLAFFVALPDGGGLRASARVLGMGALGAALALGLYYRHFLAGALQIAAAAGGAGAVTGAGPASVLERLDATWWDATRFLDAV
jgi:hypothetical protein